jgi:ABC-type branched-subunit amino acid transport system ATPase component/ABC-type branched-subunit amino acid transport system permease subunit
VKQRLGMQTLALTALLVWPFLPHLPYDVLNTAILGCEYLVIALSLVLLIGMVGQISLCQAALVGMGAFVSALFTRRFGVHFPISLVIGLVAGAATATVVGAVALRVRGLYLAVATLIFAYVCDQYLFTQEWLVGSQSGTSIAPEVLGRPGGIPSLDLADAHVFYFVALAVAALVLYGLANLRESRVGRAFAALRGSEVAAASLGVDVMRYKLLGFAMAGALAGLGGALTLVGVRTAAPEQFSFVNSLYFLSIAVVGGLRSIGGAVGAASLFAVLVGEVFFRFPKLADYLDVISAGLLIAVLLFFQGGLGALPERMAPALRRLLGRMPSPAPLDRGVAIVAERIGAVLSIPAKRLRRARPLPLAAGIDVRTLLPDADAPPVPAPQIAVASSPVGALHLEERIAGEPAADGRRTPVLLDACGVTVQFGGLTAVDDVSLRVGAGEIVGLIGPNGAGKTTMFNALMGLNQPSAGRVELFGEDVTTWPVHRRAALGVGRTFQIVQLFGDLTVFDNLLVATHLQSHTGMWGGVTASRGARLSEIDARERVDAVLRLMELEEFAERRVAGLPFGVLRLVEVARTLVTGARLVCFDEPASGLDTAETERLVQWFRLLRRIGVTLLVIEHDVPMVTRLCDHIYVLDRGRLLASGTAAEIQRDPAVVAGYLGSTVEVA